MTANNKEAHEAITEGLLLSQPEPGIAWVTIDRPATMNALTPTLNKALDELMRTLDADKAVRCIIITGAGDKAFCAGADIPTLLPHMETMIQNGQDDPQFAGVTHRAPCGKPLIAAINGAALGGGLELALACDIRIASITAKFGLPEITIGVLAGAGGCTRLPRMIPPSLAAEMILTGCAIDAGRALQCGLVSQVVTGNDLHTAALDLARMIASRAPQAVRACTELLRRPWRHDIMAALDVERQAFAGLLATKDAKEGINAFRQKRTPRFKDA